MIYVFVVKGVTRDFLIISPKKFVLCIHSSDDNHSFRFTQFLILTYMLVDSQADYRYQTKEIMLKCPLLSKGSFTNCVDKQGEGGLSPNNMSMILHKLICKNVNEGLVQKSCERRL